MKKLDKRTGNIVESNNAFVTGTWAAQPDRYVDPIDAIDPFDITVNGVSLEDLKVAELEQFAEDNKIDLGGATRKADIIAAICAGYTPPDDIEE